jgi:fatty acid desaturase
VYGIGCGMSGGWWRSQHNKHHAMPQKLGYDVDLNTLPLVAFTSKVVKRLSALHKSWIAAQAILFPLITTSLVAAGWQFYLHPRFIIRKKDWREGLMLVLRYVLWHQLITTQFGLKASIWIYLAYNWVSANYIFIDFAVSHTHLDVVPKEDTQVLFPYNVHFCKWFS